MAIVIKQTTRYDVPLSADVFLQLGERTGQGKLELVRGEVVEMAPVGGAHGQTQLRLGILLDGHVRQRRLGHVTVETGYRLATAPDTVRAPDVAFVSAARYPGARLPEGYLDGPPDLAAEVVSPLDLWQEVLQKVGEYLDAGTHMVWVVDPADQTVRVYHRELDQRPPSEQVLRGSDVLSGGHVLADLTLQVSDLWPA